MTCTIIARNALVPLILTALFGFAGPRGRGQGTTKPDPNAARMDILTPTQWKQTDEAIKRALAFLYSQQMPDGTFPTLPSGQPGVTALCVMAYLANGHAPGYGPYGDLLNRAVDFVLSTQKPDGLFCFEAPNHHYLAYTPTHTGTYNHMIAGIMLCEVYGMLPEEKSARVRRAIEQAIHYARRQQVAPKDHPSQNGGWRYVQPSLPHDSDLSVTAWAIKFLRAAENAGFEVPAQYIDEAMAYVDTCFNSGQQTFAYGNYNGLIRFNRAMAGAGVLTLSLAGLHQTPKARAAGDWILRQTFDPYNTRIMGYDQYHYSLYYCTQGMFQLGGHYWEQFFPRINATMLAAQNSDGSWQPEGVMGEDGRFGNNYTTALSVLILSTPNQLLPIYQR